MGVDDFSNQMSISVKQIMSKIKKPVAEILEISLNFLNKKKEEEKLKTLALAVLANFSFFYLKFKIK